MFFFPLRALLPLSGRPVLTVVVMIIAVLMFAVQIQNHRQFERAVLSACDDLSGFPLQLSFAAMSGDASGALCPEFLVNVYRSHDPDRAITALLVEVLPGDRPAVQKLRERYQYELSRFYRHFLMTAPRFITYDFAHHPESWSFLRAFSSVFIHQNIYHLLINLVFFFPFSSTVERVVGRRTYSLLFVVFVYGSNAVYSAVSMLFPQALPSIGLSGTVMAFLGTYLVLFPVSRLECILWVLVLFKRFEAPVWAVGLWVVAWNVGGLWFSGQHAPVNYTVHLAGILLGLTTGLIIKNKYMPSK